MSNDPIYSEFQRLADDVDTTEWTSYDWFKAGFAYSRKSDVMQEKKVRHKKMLKLTPVRGIPIVESTD
jgi:hypothetical protein